MNDSIVTIITILLGLTVLFFLLWRRSVRILKEIKFAKASLSTKYGKMTEQFMPFLARYPYDPDRFRFIGSPIDGIQFEDDRIVLVEFKVSGSRPSINQNKIRDLVEKRRVVFEEFRL